MKAWISSLLIIVWLSAVLGNNVPGRWNSYKVVCYLGSWANYRRGDGKFKIEDIDPKLCTHLIYGFAKLNEDNTIAAYDSYLDLKEGWGLGAYKRFNGLKRKNPQLKTLIAIGGWNEGSPKYSRMARSASSRRTFINSCVQFLQKYGFDGLDLDWEYPALRGGVPEDKGNFVQLVKGPARVLVSRIGKDMWHLKTDSVQKSFPGSYVEISHGSPTEAADYCKKDGNFEAFGRLPAAEQTSNAFVADHGKNKLSQSNELKETFASRGMLLTAAVSAGKNTIDKAYDVPSLARYLDFINLMAYDFHGGWDPVTGHNSPLYARPNENYEQKTFNVDYAVRYWLNKGCPADKLVLGMPLYGRSFTLNDARNSGFGAPASKGIAGEYTGEMGFLGYHEICKKLKQESGWRVTVDRHVQAPYAVNGRQWIGYDDINSITTKVRYLIKMNLGGAMVWSIETDDFRGRCHGYTNPLLRAINSALYGASSPQPNPSTNQIPRPSSTNHVPRTTVNRPKTTVNNNTPKHTTSGGSLPCSRNGYFRHPHNCKQFYVCQSQKAGYKVFQFSCGPGTVFSEKLNTCTFPHQVPGC
ncbi:chitotriosidase-1 [Caerostris darwini]|uniref:chitinase n=1 Tax=Caerostris darwini TaxID=1538125 RepID=A0AAV4MHH9_9ARAC|nr:chitotriosidase-1 [Caerostris darwini]